MAGAVPDDEASPAPPVRPTVTTTVPAQAAPRPARSEAYEALAVLGRTDPRMTLSVTDCAVLEPLAAEWLRRGATRAQLLYALTAGLPPTVPEPAVREFLARPDIRPRIASLRAAIRMRERRTP
ncbi:hypothetical protein [Streptomyces sp. H39-S7]|uniref:hypothetical protein n=1 Tax=Streptomyces sp. H39-S7 TaxID=3004357 RepID=UPI0022B0516C|nr:hypothetical protein [Streptomyces sp. H39-S7]MCZ4120648.1 hypothetical protein [Streptomyces sp. H39-S7]